MSLRTSHRVALALLAGLVSMVACAVDPELEEVDSDLAVISCDAFGGALVDEVAIASAAGEVTCFEVTAAAGDPSLALELEVERGQYKMWVRGDGGSGLGEVRMRQDLVTYLDVAARTRYVYARVLGSGRGLEVPATFTVALLAVQPGAARLRPGSPPPVSSSGPTIGVDLDLTRLGLVRRGDRAMIEFEAGPTQMTVGASITGTGRATAHVLQETLSSALLTAVASKVGRAGEPLFMDHRYAEPGVGFPGDPPRTKRRAALVELSSYQGPLAGHATITARR